MVRFLFLVTLTILLTGCGKQYGTVPVRGKVTLDGGPLPAAGDVYFTPLETFGDFPLRPASASFETDGVYSVSSFADAEGLFPGTYRVHVHCWEIPPTMDGPPARSHLPPKYARANASGLQLTVEAGSSAQEFNIDLSKSR